MNEIPKRTKCLRRQQRTIAAATVTCGITAIWGAQVRTKKKEGGGLGGPSAYREPAVSCHCSESTGTRSDPLELRWTWKSVSSHHRHQEHPAAPWLASCPQPCICEVDRWVTERRQLVCPNLSRNFPLLSRRGPAFFLQRSCMWYKVCSLWGIWPEEGSCFLLPIMYVLMCPLF